MFSFNFNQDNVNISIIQSGNNFELRINNVPFTHHNELNKNRQFFTEKPTATSFQSIKSLGSKNKIEFGAGLADNQAKKEENSMFNFKISGDKKEKGNSTQNMIDFSKNYFSCVTKGNSTNLLDLPTTDNSANITQAKEETVADKLNDIFGSSSSTINSSDDMSNSSGTASNMNVVDFTANIAENKSTEEFKPNFQQIEQAAKFDNALNTINFNTNSNNTLIINPSAAFEIDSLFAAKQQNTASVNNNGMNYPSFNELDIDITKLNYKPVNSQLKPEVFANVGLSFFD